MEEGTLLGEMRIFSRADKISLLLRAVSFQSYSTHQLIPLRNDMNSPHLPWCLSNKTKHGSA